MPRPSMPLTCFALLPLPLPRLCYAANYDTPHSEIRELAESSAALAQSLLWLVQTNNLLFFVHLELQSSLSSLAGFGPCPSTPHHPHPPSSTHILGPLLSPSPPLPPPSANARAPAVVSEQPLDPSRSTGARTVGPIAARCIQREPPEPSKADQRAARWHSSHSPEGKKT
ncbi:hypothetical protein DL95DRAFT_499699 [Leptodontidium sp. 2 PMI_412]|nr:hypothetical protein DL95DRAFT_499699 [Leptodontidium sp. 2 PMI_412]